MAERVELTEQDLIEALLAAQPHDTPAEGALTVREIMQETGWSEKRVRAQLHQLDSEGRLEVRRVCKRVLTGAMSPLPAYRLKS